MPKFTLCITQMIERTAAHEIEAADKEMALAIGDEVVKQLRIGVFPVALAWGNGDEATTPEVYSILDDEGNEIWNR